MCKRNSTACLHFKWFNWLDLAVIPFKYKKMTIQILSPRYYRLMEIFSLLRKYKNNSNSTIRQWCLSIHLMIPKYWRYFICNIIIQSKAEARTEHVHFYFILLKIQSIWFILIELNSQTFFQNFPFWELSLTLEALFTDIVALASHLLLQIRIILFNNLWYCVYYIWAVLHIV